MTNEVVVIENLNPVEVFKSGGIKPIIDAIREEVAGEVPDLTTKKGRDRIASLAHKVAKSKTALDKAGKALADDLNAQLKPINAERKYARDELDKLKEEIRQPLTEFEEAEKERIAGHENEIAYMVDLALASCDDGVAFHVYQLQSKLSELEAIELGERWEEFAQKAAEAKDKCITELRQHIEKREAYEAEQAELERLRKEAAEREQKEREDNIARQAAEQAKAKAESDAKAEFERVERERIQAEEQAKLAEQQRINAENKAKQDATDAENRRIAQENEAKRQAELAEQKRLADIEAAKNAEIARQAEENRQIEADAKAREANKAHKKAINNSAVQAIMMTGVTKAQAQQVVVMIAKGQVPNVKINY